MDTATKLRLLHLHKRLDELVVKSENLARVAESGLLSADERYVIAAAAAKIRKETEAISAEFDRIAAKDKTDTALGVVQETKH